MRQCVQMPGTALKGACRRDNLRRAPRRHHKRARRLVVSVRAVTRVSIHLRERRSGWSAQGEQVRNIRHLAALPQACLPRTSLGLARLNERPVLASREPEAAAPLAQKEGPAAGKRQGSWPCAEKTLSSVSPVSAPGRRSEPWHRSYRVSHIVARTAGPSKTSRVTDWRTLSYPISASGRSRSGAHRNVKPNDHVPSRSRSRQAHRL